MTSAHPDPTCPITDRKPLYLDRGAGLQIECDGPALVARLDGQAPRLFPLRRLSRIYVHGRAEWTTEALLACARQGIGVIFTDTDGKVAARLLGQPATRQEFHQRFADFLARADAEPQFETWRRAMQRNAILRAGRKLHAPPALDSRRGLQTWLQLRAEHYCGAQCAHRSRLWLRGMCYSWMLAHLQTLGFGANTEFGQDGCPDLAGSLGTILAWQLEPARIGWLARRHQAARHHRQPLRLPEHRDLIRMFESHHTRAARQGRRLTNQLHRWLVDLA